jgi:menaquinone-9 beta-reductase
VCTETTSESAGAAAYWTHGRRACWVGLRRAWGGYFTLGKWFVRIMGSPEVMRLATERGMPHRTLMVFVMKLMAHLTDERPSDAMDLVLNALQRAAPRA